MSATVRRVCTVIRMLTPGWWVLLEGQEADLRELAMHFGRSDLTVVEEPDGYYLGSSDLNRLTSAYDARARGAELLGLARGAIDAEVRCLDPLLSRLRSASTRRAPSSAWSE